MANIVGSQKLEKRPKPNGETCKKKRPMWGSWSKRMCEKVERRTFCTKCDPLVEPFPSDIRWFEGGVLDPLGGPLARPFDRWTRDPGGTGPKKWSLK